MDQRQLAAVLLAVVGIFFVASPLPILTVYIAMLHQAGSFTEEPLAGISQAAFLEIGIWSSVATIAVGVIILFARNRLAARLFPESSHPVVAPEAQAVALSVLGCYLAVGGVSGLFPEVLVPGGLISWGHAIQVILGVGMFFGARGLSHLWQLARTRGGTKDSR
jgi:hypothetical protein